MVRFSSKKCYFCAVYGRCNHLVELTAHGHRWHICATALALCCGPTMVASGEVAVLLRAVFLIHDVTLILARLPRALYVSIYAWGYSGVASRSCAYTVC